MGFAMPSSERKHLIERFSLSDDGRHLVYDVTIEDPATTYVDVDVEVGADAIAMGLSTGPIITVLVAAAMTLLMLMLIRSETSFDFSSL